MHWCLQDLLYLTYVDGLGPNRIRNIVERFSADEFMGLATDDLVNLGFATSVIKQLKKPDERQFECDMRWLESNVDHHIITMLDNSYPLLLRECHGYPVALYVIGDLAGLGIARLAVVGSRKATTQGLQIARTWSERLAVGGVVIISGLAMGIDGAAHRGALAGGGKTIGVMATGPSQIYPRCHERLAEQIVAGGGCLITEFRVGAPVVRANFPRRNRIMSGLAQACLVVEAAERSGSLVTARWVVEQNRDLFVVAGGAENERFFGNLSLIRSGAACVGSYNDLLADLPSAIRDQMRVANDSDEMLDGLGRRVLEYCRGHDKADFEDILAAQLGPQPEVIALLSKLEYIGLVSRRSRE